MQRYLLYSTIAAVFSEAFLFRVGFDLKFMYGIVLINLLLIISQNPLKLPRALIYVILFLIVSGVFSILLYQNEASRVAFQIVGFSIMSIYFYNFFRFSKYSLLYIFEKYCKYAYYISILGLFIFAVLLVTGFDINRFLSQYLPFYGYPFNPNEYGSVKVKGIFLEPAHFGGIILPAFTYYLLKFKENTKRALITGIALFLTFSSITYVGLLLSFLFSQKRIKFFRLAIITSVCLILSVLAYRSIDDVKLRIDDTFSVLSDTKYNFEGVNLSTYALLSNLYVTSEVFKSNPIMGHGIGSHPISHKSYIYGISGNDVFEELGLSDINSTDANSLFLRLLSEMGIVSLIFVFFFIKNNYSTKYSMISKSILVYFVYKLIRDGHYFPPELYFFVFIFYFLHKLEKERPDQDVFQLPIHS